MPRMERLTPEEHGHWLQGIDRMVLITEYRFVEPSWDDPNRPYEVIEDRWTWTGVCGWMLSTHRTLRESALSADLSAEEREEFAARLAQVEEIIPTETRTKLVRIAL